MPSLEAIAEDGAHGCAIISSMGSDEVKQAILARRARFIAAALASATAAAYCGGKAVIDGEPRGSEATAGGGGVGGGFQVCLSTTPGGEGGVPQPCLESPLGGSGGIPEPCLTAPPVGGGGAGGRP